MSPSPAGVAFLTFFGAIVPYSAIKARRLRASTPSGPRVAYHRRVVIQQLAFLIVAIGVAIVDQIPILPGRLDLEAWAFALVVLAALIALMWPVWRRTVAMNDPGLERFVPRTALERRWWLAVSLSAGICEEVVWRGVLMAELWWIVGSWWIAAAIASLLFGVAHAIQGWRKAVIITVIAVLCHLLVRWSGGLVLAMVVHAGYDAVAGLAYAKLLALREQRE